MAIKGYYTLSGAQTLKTAQDILKEFIECDSYSKSIYNKHFRVIKQSDWLKELRQYNHELFRKA